MSFKKNMDVLKDIWDKMYSEFNNDENSNSAIIHFTTSKSVHKFELEYLMYWNIYTMISIAPDHEKTKETLEYAGIKLTKEQIGLANRIELKRKDIKDHNQDDKKVDVWQIIGEIESITGRAIDIKNTTMRQYLAIKKTIKNGRERQDNAKGRN